MRQTGVEYKKRTMQKKHSIEILRALCAVEVFFLHYCASHIGPETVAWFCGAVPAFLLMSAYLYGIREPQPVYGVRFFCRRWLTLGATYYPFLLCVFVVSLVSGQYPIGELLRGLVTDVFFLVGFNSSKTLPGCGHLWFMTILMLCYLALVVVGNSGRVRRVLRSGWGVGGAFVALLLIGFTYRGGGIPVRLFAYVVLFFNADRLHNLVSTRRRTLLTVGVALVCYALVVMQMAEWFRYAAYLQHMATCLIGVVTIALAERYLAHVRLGRCITFLSDISMEIYLVHHLFVYDQPLYVSVPLTLVLSVLLHFVGRQAKKRL